jgi:hypothetical protein
MVKITSFVELPIVCEAHLQSPKLPLRAFPFYPFKKPIPSLLKELEKKSALLCPEGKVGQISEHFIGGSILLSNGGSLQLSVKDCHISTSLCFQNLSFVRFALGLRPDHGTRRNPIPPNGPSC